MNPTKLRPKWQAVLGLALLAAHAPAAITVTDPGQGVFDFSGNAAELSGLAWLSGNTFQAVGDTTGLRQVYELNIGVNPLDGRVTGAAVIGASTLAAGYDLEGIAHCPQRATWFVSDEGEPPGGGQLREHTLPDGGLVGTVAIPAPLQNVRPNFSLESCTWAAGALWTANEEALAQESALSTATSGSLVRLQRFDHQLNPAGQWAYQTDSFGFDSGLPAARSGVADLLALPDGNLLVLERALGFGYRNRIYLVDFSGATDVSGIGDLDGAAFTPVVKTLLWEKNMGSFSTRNFEGIALGPALGGGGYSVLLVADNGGGTQQHLYALVVNGVVAPPPMAQWRQAWWGTPAATGSAADDGDPDGDGLANLLEYALGGIPTVAGQAPLPQHGIVAGKLALTFTRTLANTDITLTVQAADTLAGPWTDLARSANGGPMTALVGGVAVTESGTGATRVVQVGDLYLTTDPAHRSRFLRLRVTHF